MALLEIISIRDKSHFVLGTCSALVSCLAANVCLVFWACLQHVQDPSLVYGKLRGHFEANKRAAIPPRCSNYADILSKLIWVVSITEQQILGLPCRPAFLLRAYRALRFICELSLCLNTLHVIGGGVRLSWGYHSGFSELAVLNIGYHDARPVAVRALFGLGPHPLLLSIIGNQRCYGPLRS